MRMFCLKEPHRPVFTKDKLLRLKLKAIRRGVWFRALRRIDRVMISLATQVVDRVSSPLLNRSLFLVAEKIEAALESRISHVMREIGFSLVSKASLAAQKWGNDSAKNWVSDLSFVRFLAIMHINDPKVFRP